MPKTKRTQSPSVLEIYRHISTAFEPVLVVAATPEEAARLVGHAKHTFNARFVRIGALTGLEPGVYELKACQPTGSADQQPK